MTSKTDGTTTFTYTWDDQGRLTQVQRTGTSPFTVSYAYDSLGRLLTRTDAAGTSKFVWDGWNCVREIGPDATTTDYYLPQGELLSFKRGSSTYQVHADALGSIRSVSDSIGTITAHFEYGAHGETLASSVDNVPGGFPYRFVGGLGVRYDAVSNLVYMRNRWYDSSLARFLSRDPMREGNPYAYAANSPTSQIDPMGLQATIIRGPQGDTYIGPGMQFTPDGSRILYLHEYAVDPNFSWTEYFQNVTKMAISLNYYGNVATTAYEIKTSGFSWMAAAGLIPIFGALKWFRRATAPYKEFVAAGIHDAHHVVQNAAVKNLPRQPGRPCYRKGDAPAVHLPGPATVPGTPHYAATQVQRRAVVRGTYEAERQVAIESLKAAGLGPALINRIMKEVDEYFIGVLGISPGTTTRIPWRK